MLAVKSVVVAIFKDVSGAAIGFAPGFDGGVRITMVAVEAVDDRIVVAIRGA